MDDFDAVASSEIEDRITEFFNSYYINQINEMFISYPKKRSVLVDIKDLERYDIDIATELYSNPDAVIPLANNALSKMNPNTEAKEPAYARFFGSDAGMPLIQDVGSEHIGKLLSLDSLVVKRSEIIPRVHLAKYKCLFCGTAMELKIDREEVTDICPQCKRRSLRQINSESKFVNMQRLAVQDPLERLKGSTPTWHLEVILNDDLVNTIIPGDRVDITGILRIRPRRTQKGKEDKVMFTPYFDTVALKPKQKEFAELEISTEEERIIKEMSRDPAIFDKISKSIATSIYGHDEIKKALALQLFGGTPDKKLIDGGAIRSDIHIMLIGDPGSAKTRLLQAVVAIVPKGIYVSGKSTTSAGLTASAERDEFSEGGWTLKAGAMVLGNGGEIGIDEFDKVSDDDKSSLLEALESQTISVAKAGIVAKFSAKTSVLAAANPKYGRFEKDAYPADQFNISPALLSRFDLIFPITDNLDEEQDIRIARHILTQHEAAGAQVSGASDYEQVAAPPIGPEILRKYVAYARRNVKPRLTQESSKKIEEYYIGLRKLGIKQGATPITPRQIEGLVRMAEASSKSRLVENIELKDAELAIFLFDYMFKTLAVDSAGRYDIDRLMTGFPKEKVGKINAIISLIKKLDKGSGVSLITVLDEAESNGMSRDEAGKYINELERSGDIFVPKPGILRIVPRDEE
ncbi:MAG: minichromosome maintenance protein MCM [Candidatus Marsarchaeota archaeon]|nr:minichromosome maintenance protein MCM [Candidatus Marsarchaeota archaeon]